MKLIKINSITVEQFILVDSEDLQDSLFAIERVVQEYRSNHTEETIIPLLNLYYLMYLEIANLKHLTQIIKLKILQLQL